MVTVMLRGVGYCIRVIGTVRVRVRVFILYFVTR